MKKPANSLFAGSKGCVVNDTGSVLDIKAACQINNSTT